MDDHSYLHEGETLLLSMRPSAAEAVRGIIAGMFEGIIAGLVLSLGIFFLSGFRFFEVAFLILPLLATLFAFRRWRLWRRSSLRITTQRILLQYPGPLSVERHSEGKPGSYRERLHHVPQIFFTAMLRTMKWTQYQECRVGERGLLDLLFRSRPLFLRFGTPDAERELSFPSLTYALDLKHYLDKVDSAVQAGDTSSIRPFVAKPRGQRD